MGHLPDGLVRAIRAMHIAKGVTILSPILDLDPIYQYTQAEQLALESIILQGRPADLAFRQWIEYVDFENIDNSMTQLLPALYATHTSWNGKFPYAPRSKGALRLSFARNSLLLSAASQAIIKLQECGLEPMIYKGASLGLFYYKTPALRPMGDVDILVHPEEYKVANEILQEQGWKYRYPTHLRLTAQHSCDYVNESGQALDLHVRTLLEVNQTSFDEGILARSRCMNWNEIKIRVPSPEDEALLCAVNGMRDFGNSRLLWIYDLANIIRSSQEINWERLWERAIYYGLSTPFFHALQMAGNIRGLEVLHEILVELISMSPNFESDYLYDSVKIGNTYGLGEQQRRAINNIISTSSDSIIKNNKDNLWADLNETRGAFGRIRIFQTPLGKIKGLHLRWHHAHLIPTLFHVTDHDAWHEISVGFPSAGEGIIEIKPGLLEPSDGMMPEEAYRADISLDSDLPNRMECSDLLIICASITNDSTYPWLSLSLPPNKFGFSWHLCDMNGSVICWDNIRAYLQPTLRDKTVTFIEPGSKVKCQIPFVAPERPGHYKIHFDVVHEHVRWFSSLTKRLPVWDLTVYSSMHADARKSKYKMEHR